MSWNPSATTETFSPTPRNLDLGIYTVNNSAASTKTVAYVNTQLGYQPGLQNQAKTALGTYIWDTYF